MDPVRTALSRHEFARISIVLVATIIMFQLLFEKSEIMEMHFFISVVLSSLNLIDIALFVLGDQEGSAQRGGCFGGWTRDFI
jgi:hypothetical protein